MKHAFGLNIPQTLEEACDPQRTALLVYDMQIGILSQLPDAAPTTARVVRVLAAARAAGVRVFFTRHLSLPKETSGVFLLRQAMAWQRVSTVAEVHPWFLRDAPGFQISPEVAPLPSEAVVDKITMAAFEGTFLNIALRDCAITTVIVVGFALEIGIEPTVRHATDLGYLPVVVTDACGGRDEAARQRALDGFAFAGDAMMTDTASLCDLLAKHSPRKETSIE
ncbi:putative isochorismatase hydrolase [Capsulimonas corticalis]|uniref:Isochorismatase hydrolase n=1 Tax=Capsulimonas corticalis TaxID=2219043 RepID=A0A402D089_9BACT|nr:cysteine hydrolase [Capsulimonas corticalis]BDI33714.1 putative isochorismatase hydrolase [Capsulimonas corticalis]